MVAVETTTESGLILMGARHLRASEVPQIDPREHEPNDNLPVGSVGPNVAIGQNAVMYPNGGMHSEAWTGWPTEWMAPPYGDAWSGVGFGRFNSEMSLRVSTVANCTDLISRTIGTFPLVSTVNSQPRVPQPLWCLNPEPKVYANRADWVKSTINSLLYRGEAFQVATHRSGGYPDRFVNVSPDAIDLDGTAAEPEYSIGGVTLDSADVCHIRHQVWASSMHGIGPLEWSSGPIIAARAMEAYAANLATRGGIPWAVLTHPDELDSDQTDDLQGRWVTAASSRYGAPAVLSGGITLQPLTLSPKDMALLEMRTFDEQRICAAMGVFPVLVNLEQPGGSMTYSNISTLFEAFWRQTLRPMAMNIASALSQWALPRTQDLFFDAEQFVRPPLPERATAYSTLFNIIDPVTGHRAIEVDEIRALENFGTADAMGLVTSGVG